MNVLLAGGSGFIGTALTKALLAHGHTVTVLSRRPEQARLPEGAQAAGWDARTPNGWGHLVEETDAVVNLVGENLGKWPWSAERKARILFSRQAAGQAIYQAILAARQRPKVLLQASGIGYYGLTGDRVVTEADPIGTDFLAGVCREWEGATRPVEELGVRWVAARSGLVLHGREGIFSLVLLPFRLFVGGRLGSGRQWFPWIHLDDEVQGMLAVLENDQASGPFNFVAPHALTNAELGKTIAKVMHRPYWFPVPGFAMRLVLGDMALLVLDGQRAVPECLQEMGYKFRFETMEGALQDLI